MRVGNPPQPAAEGTPGFVDGDDSWAGRAEEGAVGEDEAEGGEGFYEAAGLRAEDFAVDAAAVQAEEAGVVEGWVGGGHFCLLELELESERGVCGGWAVRGRLVGC